VFDAVRRGYLRAVAATLRVRPAVYIVWIAITLMVAPLYMFAPKELAPMRTRVVVFGAL